MFKPNRRSIKRHNVPEWFHDAKLGIFIHWGIYSVPAFAEISRKSYHEIQKESGIDSQFLHNPYAEWYQNSLRLKHTKTYDYHMKEFGADFKYEDFAPIFNAEIKKWDPEDMASLFEQAGAKYAVLVTKHHDGFTMWPSKYQNPNNPEYHANRDIVGELKKAVEKRNIRLGLYYSGKLDWSFEKNFIKDFPTMLDNEPRHPEYPKYAENHWYELIEKYNPWILWNDIGYPARSNKLKIFAHFYNKNLEGLINNRWMQLPSFIRWLIRRPLVTKIVNKAANRYVSKKKDTRESREIHSLLYDFSTPEYQVETKIKNYKWETCRGLGNSFGYNKQENEEHYLSSKELVHQLIDVVSKNGNLLINVGPIADGTIPEIQKNLLLDLGTWLKTNGEAIYGTRPWKIAETMVNSTIPVRFTSNRTNIYAILLETPQKRISFPRNIGFSKIRKVEILGIDLDLSWELINNSLTINIPDSLRESDAYAFKIVT